MMLWKCCTQYASKFEKLSSGHRTGKGQFLFHLKESHCQKCSNCCTIAFIPHASKVMLKILQVGLKSIWTENFQMFKLDLEKAEEPEIKLPHPLDHRKSKRIKKNKNLLLLLLGSYWFVSFIVPVFTWSVPLVSLIFLKRFLVIPILLFSSISLHCS